MAGQAAAGSAMTVVEYYCIDSCLRMLDLRKTI